MPVVSRFYGIVIRLYFREHGVPHFHALYGEHNAVFAIDTLEISWTDELDLSEAELWENGCLVDEHEVRV